MAELPKRLAQAATTYNVSVFHLVEKLREWGFILENKPTLKLSNEMILMLEQIFAKDKGIKEQADTIKFTTKFQREITAEFDYWLQYYEDRDKGQRKGVYKNAYLVGSPGYSGLPCNDSPECIEYWNLD